MYNELEIGQVVISKAGHDKGQFYVIVDKKEEYVYVVDGKYKMVSNPKKKNIKHIQKVNAIVQTISEKYLKNQKIEDADYRKILQEIKR